jgi:tetratricopeptide (TPR) repeat protein
MAGFFLVSSASYASTWLAELGRFDEGIARGTEALQTGQVAGLMYALGMAQHRLAYVHLLRGEVSKAAQLLEQCAELARRADLPVLHPHVAAGLGEVYCQADQTREAVALILEASSLANAGGNRMWNALNLTQLAKAYSLAGRKAEAEEATSQAVDSARRFNQRGTEAWALFASGDVSARSRPENPSESAAAYQAAAALASELKMRPLEARCRFALGELDLRAGRRDDARRSITSAVSMFREMGMNSYLAQAERALSQVAS